MAAPHDEFAPFARALVGEVPAAKFRQRYVAGCRACFGEPAPESAALALARRRPWAVTPLDAACGILRPRDPLRQRLLLLTAILEASPEYADHFLPRRLSWFGLFVLLPARVALAGLRAVVGIALLLTVAEVQRP